RRAAADDLPLLVRWMEAFFEDMGTSSGDPYFVGAVLSHEAARAAFEAAMAAGELIVVAAVDEAPRGYLLARSVPPVVSESPIRRIGHVSHCYVELAARRLGVASALLAAAERWFRDEGARYAELSYLLRNEPAARTWSKLGYAPMRVFARK